MCQSQCVSPTKSSPGFKPCSSTIMLIVVYLCVRQIHDKDFSVTLNAFFVVRWQDTRLVMDQDKIINNLKPGQTKEGHQQPQTRLDKRRSSTTSNQVRQRQFINNLKPGQTKTIDHQIINNLKPSQINKIDQRRSSTTSNQVGQRQLIKEDHQ